MCIYRNAKCYEKIYLKYEYILPIFRNMFCMTFWTRVRSGTHDGVLTTPSWVPSRKNGLHQQFHPKERVAIWEETEDVEE